MSELQGGIRSALVGLVLLGCGGMSDLHEDLRTIEGLWSLSGIVSAPAYEGGTVVAAILRAPTHDGAPWQIVDFQQMTRPGRFRFIVPPGRYRAVAFIDANGDLEYEPSERLGAYREYEEIGPGTDRDQLDIEIQGAMREGDAAPQIAAPTAQIRSLVIGEVESLDAERFEQAIGVMGVWQPMRFMVEYGAGLWMLQEYDADKTPVVFIHGISGYPQEFREIIANLDTERFQPWVVQYPSGWDLADSADYFHRGLEEMYTAHSFERLCLVAHSMGGVVSREMLNRHFEARETSYISAFITIAAPLGGHPAAAMGATMSPVVVPSWRNLVPDGEFMQQLYRRPLREETYHSLFFTLRDGVVPLQSQLRAEALDEADFTHHFPNTHVGVLESESLGEHLAVALDRCRGDRGGAPVEAASDAAQAP